jgi:hypothetical protein
LFAKSLATAQSQGARYWELRTACDLASHWQSQGRVKEAFGLLQPIYAQFPDDVTTKDLLCARLILDNVKPSGRRRNAQPKKRGASEANILIDPPARMAAKPHSTLQPG